MLASAAHILNIGTIQGRLAWPLRKDDMQIYEEFHIFKIKQIKWVRKWMECLKSSLFQFWDNTLHLHKFSAGILFSSFTFNNEPNKQKKSLKLKRECFIVNFLKQFLKEMKYLKSKQCRFPWWLSGKNIPVSARDMGSIPGPGRFHMPQSNWAQVL